MTSQTSQSNIYHKKEIKEKGVKGVFPKKNDDKLEKILYNKDLSESKLIKLKEI